MKKRGIILIFLLAAVLITTGAAILQHDQQKLSDKLIRLHVVANSDSQHDQNVKLAVRDAVLKAAEEITAGAPSPREALASELDTIAEAAQQTLAALGEEHTVHVRLGKEVFPLRRYDTFSLPSGVYESLRVTIGSGEGHNWWCVVFPSLCLPASMEEMELAAQAAGLSDAEIRLITSESEGYVLRFKLLEIMQRLKDSIFG